MAIDCLARDRVRDVQFAVVQALQLSIAEDEFQRSGRVLEGYPLVAVDRTGPIILPIQLSR